MLVELLDCFGFELLYPGSEVSEFLLEVSALVLEFLAFIETLFN